MVNSIKKNDEFRYIYRKGKSYANKYLVMYIADRTAGSRINGNRIGISVSKKVGNSVVRHRVTRKIREIYRLNDNKMVQKKDIVVVARVNAKNAVYSELESAYLHLCRLHNILIEQSWLYEKNIDRSYKIL